MPSSHRSLSSPAHHVSITLRQLLARGRRRLLCLALIFGLLIVPDAGYAISSASSLVVQVAKDTVAPMPVAVEWFKRLFRRSARPPRQETPGDRLAYVTQLQVTPRRLVGYLGQTVTFTALPLDASRQVVQGVRFNWESSDADKAVIDDAGRARLLHPGLVRITCRAGNVQATVPLLVRPGHRPRQSDAEWQADQQSLNQTATNGAHQSSAVEASAVAWLDHLTPTAQAQVGWTDDLAYDELWNDPRNLVGSPRNRVAEGTRVGTVLPEGSNFSFAAPITSLGGRGLGANLALYYNSRLWSRRSNSMAYNGVVGWPSPGFSLGFGRIVTYDVTPGDNPTCKYMLIDPDGTRHYLGSGSWAGSGYDLGGPFESNDGSHIVYTGNGSHGGYLYYPDGTSVYFSVVNNRLLPTTISDRNGNYVQVAYKPDCVQTDQGMYCQVFAPMAIDYITDTLGRVIQFNYDTSYRLTSITVPGYGGTSQQPVTQTVVQFDYQTVTANGTFSGLTVERSTGVSITTLKHIYFPATGTGYMPTYSIYGVVTSLSGRRQMSIGYSNTIQDGVESNNASFNYPTTGPLSDAPAFTQRSESAVNAPPATYTYASSTNGLTQEKTFTITQPDNSTLNLTRSTNASSVAYGLLVRGEVRNSSGAMMAKTELTYVNDGGSESQVQAVTSYDDAGTPTKVAYDYDSYGNLTNTREYGYQAGGQWQVRRRTRTVYKTDSGYVNAYLRSLVIESDIYDAQLNTNDSDDVLMAKATYTYDDYNAMSGMEEYRDAQGQLPPNPPGHLSWYDANYTLRGNVTGATQWYDLASNLAYTRLRKVDVFGNTVKEQLACCNEQTQMASPTYLYAMADQVTKGSAGGPQLTEQIHYDFNSGRSDWRKDANNLQTQYAYDPAWRVTQVIAPSGLITSTIYNDGSLTITRTVTYNDEGTPKAATTATETDGWGRVIKQTNEFGGQVNTTYDAMGRVASVSNPFAAGGTPLYWTSYSYDALGRTTTVTLPDGQTTQSSYSGNSVIVTDQVNRKTQQLMDGLDQLVRVNEQDSSGNLTQATNYTYDALGNLTEVNQGGQIRKNKYDDLSRLIAEKIPEQGDPSQPNQWTTTSTYTASDAVATRTDIRGVVTTYTYDMLNRLTQVSYNTVSGVTTAPTVTYIYDADGGPGYNTVAAGKLLRVKVGTGYQERYTFDSNYRIVSVVQTIGTRSYTTTYNSYNEANQLIQMTYPSGQALYFRHDSMGKVSGLANYPSGGSGTAYMVSHTHDVAGQVSNLVFGNGITEQVGYDAARMQMTSMKAGTASPYTNRLDLTYSYSAGSGQMGVGSTAGNAGQLMSVSGTINGTSESAGYTYDNYSRLATSNQTSNSNTAQRRFAYDRWNNRTGVWDAVTGGNQIQAVTLAQSGGVPTNRISSVTTASTVNYTYDAAGNVTGDGAHSYTYDSENRLVSVDGGLASYAYDHQNRRYATTVGGSVTHYIWKDDRVLAEHNGGTGAGLADYIYAGSRMLVSIVGGTPYHLLSDPLSVRLSLNATGAVKGRQAHLSFGEDFAESGTQQKQHFTSYERDGQSGTDYALNRHYAAAIGRFFSSDSFKLSADATLPQSWNRYAYAMNAPIDFIDPFGLNPEKPAPLDPCNDDLPPSEPQSFCWVTLGFKKVLASSSSAITPAAKTKTYYHSYILMEEFGGNGKPVSQFPNFFRGGPSNGGIPDFGTIVAEGGFYTQGTVDYPKPNEPAHKRMTLVPQRGNCSDYYDSFVDSVNYINGRRTPYFPLGPNSNSVTYTLLYRSRLIRFVSFSRISQLLGSDGRLPGWGMLL
jgi:RHS repeat-associated protein